MNYIYIFFYKGTHSNSVIARCMGNVDCGELVSMCLVDLEKPYLSLINQFYLGKKAQSAWILQVIKEKIDECLQKLS